MHGQLSEVSEHRHAMRFCVVCKTRLTSVFTALYQARSDNFVTDRGMFRDDFALGRGRKLQELQAKK
jgi:hypothetical protein